MTSKIIKSPKPNENNDWPTVGLPEGTKERLEGGTFKLQGIPDPDFEHPSLIKLRYCDGSTIITPREVSDGEKGLR